MNILIGTNNPGKIMEIEQALESLTGGLNPRLTIQTPSQIGITDVPEEHGNTFEANALEKARFYQRQALIPTLSDDSGILVAALQKELGIHTRRWGAGKYATDEEWITFFLDRMSRETHKRARFVCTLAFIDAEGNEHLFEGMCDGVITEQLEASYLPGLPISACFKPDGFDYVYSALSVEEKNRVSHRGKALQAFKSYLENMMRI